MVQRQKYPLKRIDSQPKGVKPLPAVSTTDEAEPIASSAELNPALQPEEQPHLPNWATILWREWRHTPDEEYAHHLFEILGTIGLDRPNRRLLSLFGALYGLLLGGLLGLVGFQSEIGLAASRLLPWLGMGIGGVIGAGIGRWLGKELSWRVWLGLLTPSVFANKLGGTTMLNVALLAGLLMGFVNINIPTSLILAGLLGYLISNIVKEDTTKVFGAVIAGGIGVILGGLIFQGGGLATALIFGLGMWFGVTLGSLPLGLLILGLGLLGGVAIFGVGAWLTSWLGLGLGFILGLVPNLMGEGINDREAYQHRAWYFWWPNQPLVSLVQQALLTAQNYYISDLELKRVWRKALPSLTPQKNKKTNPNDLISVLQYGHWLERLVARWGLIDLGGEAVPPLQQLLAQNRLECQEKVMDLLTSIEQETTVRLAGRLSYLLCPHCLARFGGHTVTVSWGISFTYYGCRRCQQSREFSEIAQVVVVLDNTWTEPHFQQEGRLLVNWLQRRTLFDFDSVLIGQASDEQIERFAVQVGNDTDPIHQFYYRRMTCSVKNSSNLSKNTLRILQRMFRAVKFLKTA